MSSVFLEEMTWREAEARRRESNIAVIPVGSTEVHGSHLLMGIDTYIAQALAKEVVERTGGVVAPAMSMTYSGGTRSFTGTISLPMPLMVEYLTAVCKSLIEQGFERTMIVEHHGPYTAAQMVVRQIYEDLGVAVLLYAPCIRPDSVKEVFVDGDDNAAREASLLLGALKLLGKESLLDLSWIQEDGPSMPRPECMSKIGATGAYTGHFYEHETQHQPLRAHCTAEKGIAAIKHSADLISAVADPWADYVKYTAERFKNGWRVTEWE